MRPALFLDRDGVINVEKNYVYRIEDFEFIDGIFELCKTAQKMGYAIVVVTNQAGIGRGYYTVEDFYRITNWMIEKFQEQGIRIDGVYFCPFHPSGGIGEYKRDSFDRKPNPGMFLRAQNELGIDMRNSVLVGDKTSDLEAGRSAGVAFNIFLANNVSCAGQDTALVFDDLRGVTNWLATNVSA